MRVGDAARGGNSLARSLFTLAPPPCAWLHATQPIRTTTASAVFQPITNSDARSNRMAAAATDRVFAALEDAPVEKDQPREEIIG